jgi:NADH-quinone oxidoreductase subunit N
VMDLIIIKAELATLALALLVFLADLFSPQKSNRQWLGWLSGFGFLALFTWMFFEPVTGVQTAFEGTFVNDALAWLFKLMFLAAAAIVSFMSLGYLDFSGIKWKGEYYFLLAIATVSLMFVVSAADLIVLYVALELSTISFYALVAMLKGQSPFSSEAGFKYLVLSITASAFMLFGISLLYGITGSTAYTTLGSWPWDSTLPLLALAVVFVLAGFGFKLTLVPFHMWAPDIYQAAPTPVTGFLSVVSKAAGLAALIRLFVSVLEFLEYLWIPIIVILTAVTLIVANLIALKQQNLKRLLAYSSISQSGYFLLGVLAITTYNDITGLYAVIYYMFVYLFSNLAIFAVLSSISADNSRDFLSNLAGLSKRSPVLALVMALGLLSLAGIPPLGGFFGKYYLFAVAVKAEYIWLVALAVLTSIISLFYYLLAIKQMYLVESGEDMQTVSHPATVFVLFVCAVMILFLGLAPAFGINFIEASF